MNYTESYQFEYLLADREWITADTFDNETDAVRVFNRECALSPHRTYHIRRVMSVVITQCSRGI